MNKSIEKQQGITLHNKSHLQKKQYLNTENFIKEESSEENQIVTEDEADRLNQLEGVMNRR
jgi:hypothetical protein